jgi:hypothetical protein
MIKLSPSSPEDIIMITNNKDYGMKSNPCSSGKLKLLDKKFQIQSDKVSGKFVQLWALINTHKKTKIE